MAAGDRRRVTDDGGVGEGSVVLAADHLGGDVGLQVVGHDGDLVLTGRHALLGQLPSVVLLGCAGLQTDRLAARIGRIEVLGVALGYAESRSDLNVGDKVCLLLALRGDRERGDADVELGAERRNDRWKLGVGGRSLGQAHDLGEGARDVDVVALGGLRIISQKLRRGVVRRGPIA